VQAAQRQADEKLKATEAERAALAGRVAELEKALDEQRRQVERTAAEHDKAMAGAGQQLKTQSEAQAQLQSRFAEQVRLVTECSNKNDRLFQLNTALIERYRSKGVVDVLQQRDPLLGFGEVQMFNRAQDERDKSDAERFAPAADRR
jgi:hypothetical protein